MLWGYVRFLSPSSTWIKVQKEVTKEVIKEWNFNSTSTKPIYLAWFLFSFYIFCLCKAKNSLSGQTSREIETDFLSILVLISLKVKQNSSHLIIFSRNQRLISQVLREMRIINIMRDQELISLKKNHVTWILCHCKRNQDHNSQKIRFEFPWTFGLFCCENKNTRSRAGRNTVLIQHILVSQ